MRDEWVKKLWHMLTMKYDTNIRKNEIMLFAISRIELEWVELKMEREEDKFWMISLIYGTYINEVRELSVLNENKPLSFDVRIEVIK